MMAVAGLGIRRWMMLHREYVGISLHAARVKRGLRLRDVSAASGVALGYISEVERGMKECSSEVLSAILSGLGLDLVSLYRDIGWRASAGVRDPFSEVWWPDEIETHHEMEMV